MRYRPLGGDPEDPRLGRLVPDDFEHVAKYPLTAALPATVASVEVVLPLPSWHWTHDQGTEGSCVGHGTVMERAVVNTMQRKAAGQKPYTRRYDPLDLWERAKLVDEWPETNPGDHNGTSVRAAYDVLRNSGARPIKLDGIHVESAGGLPVVTDTSQAPDPAEGVVRTRWAVSVDELRSGLAQRVPITIGVNWYEGLDTFQQRPAGSGRTQEAWVGAGNLGRIRGGHCVCLYGASDERQAFKIKNSWGRSYPPVWLPYAVMRRLLAEDGEAAITTDK